MIGLGCRRLSMAAAGLGAVKSMIRSLPLAPLADYLLDLRGSADHSVREHLRGFALDHGIRI